MTKKKVIVTDIDQALLDYMGRLREFVNKRDGKSIKGHSDDWDMTCWLQLDSYQDSIDTIHEFAKSFEFGTLTAFPDAGDSLITLIREGYYIICLTACGDDPITVALRKANLRLRFGDIFEGVYFVDYGESKANTLMQISEDYDIEAFIDDKPCNVFSDIFF